MAGLVRNKQANRHCVRSRYSARSCQVKVKADQTINHPPLGKQVAGVHHLRFVQHTFSKDQHGLRERDINHKDRQNYDAVLHITSQCVMMLLSQIPDTKGTSAFLKVQKNLVYRTLVYWNPRLSELAIAAIFYDVTVCDSSLLMFR